MSISTAAKIGGAALASGGVPATSFVVYDSFFSLYKVEKDMLEENVFLKVEKQNNTTPPSSEQEIYLKIYKDTSWECIVKAKSNENISTSDNSSSTLITAISDKLPKENDSSGDKEKADKQRNKKNLVKNCSKNRKPGEAQSDDKVVSEITVFLKDKGSAQNPRWTFEDESLGQLFGKGFWI